MVAGCSERRAGRGGTIVAVSSAASGTVAAAAVVSSLGVSGRRQPR